MLLGTLVTYKFLTRQWKVIEQRGRLCRWEVMITHFFEKLISDWKVKILKVKDRDKTNWIIWNLMTTSRSPIKFRIYKFEVQDFYLSLTVFSNKILINLKFMSKNKNYRCTSLTSFVLVAKRREHFVIWWKIVFPKSIDI